MAKKHTTESFKKRCKEIFGDKYDLSKVNYIDRLHEVTLICPIHGEFKKKPQLITSNHQGCPYCSKYSITNDDFIKRLKDVHKDKYDYSKVIYRGYESNITLVCPIHGAFTIMAGLALRGYGCKKCGMNNKPQTKPMSNERFIEKLNDKWKGKFTPLEEYKGANVPIKFRCNNCGNMIEKTPHIMLDKRKKVNCKYCIESSLELKVKKALEKNNINFIYQYHNLWLGLQSLDFYLPDYKIAIECQGEQHYSPNNYFGGQKEFDKIRERDERKLNKCLRNNVKLLYFADKKHNGNDIIDCDDLINKIREQYTS